MHTGQQNQKQKESNTVFAVAPDDTVFVAIQLMAEKSIGDLVKDRHQRPAADDAGTGELVPWLARILHQCSCSALAPASL